MRKTIGDRVWAYMTQERRAMGSKEIATGIDKSQRSVEYEIQRLREQGCVTRTNPCPKHSKWQLTGKERIKNGDGRGLSPGSIKALQNWVRSGGQFGNLKYVKTKLVDGRYHPRPIAKTALEQMWGWIPNQDSRRVADDADMGFNGGGTVRPKITEAA